MLRHWLPLAALDGEPRTLTRQLFLEVTHDDLTLTLEQIPGYIKALEGDVLDAQAELRRLRAAEDAARGA
jgi:hypothetical protein